MGWNGSVKTKASERDEKSSRVCLSDTGKHSKRKIKIAFLCVLALGVSLCCFFVCSRHASEVRLEKLNTANAGYIAEVTNRVIRKQVAAQKQNLVTKRPKNRYENATILSAETNQDGVVFTDYRLADGSLVTRKTLPPPIFSNVCDQVIAMIVSAHGNQKIPPLPPLNESIIRKGFQEGLLNPIRIGADDSPKVAALKLAVMDVRRCIAENLHSGDSRSFVQMINDHVKAFNDNVDFRHEAIKELKMACEGVAPEDTKVYLDKVNEHLEKMGIEKIDSVPGTVSRQGKTNQ